MPDTEPSMVMMNREDGVAMLSSSSSDDEGKYKQGSSINFANFKRNIKLDKLQNNRYIQPSVAPLSTQDNASIFVRTLGNSVDFQSSIAMMPAS
jgi:hypothetical protein